MSATFQSPTSDKDDSQSVGINITNAQVRVGGDIVGRDKIVGYTADQVSVLIAQIRTQFQPKPFDGRSPYIGLDVFGEEDADRFFGREALVAQLVARIKTANALIIAGPSGSGKSSLVRAGLMHALKGGALPQSKGWLYALLSPGRNPVEQLALAVARMTRSPDSGDYVRKNSSDSNALLKITEAQLSDDRRQRALIVVDQFEEVFTQVSNEDERRAFLDLLVSTAMADGERAIVLLAMRSDFVANCATYPRLNDLLNRQFVQVGPMQFEELVSAIARPALEVGLQIDPKLVAHIANEMRDEPGALPLMQFALKDLFDAQQQKGVLVALTLDDYLARGGLRQSLERHADAKFAALSQREQQLARMIFSHLVEPGRGTADTRRTARMDELVPSGAERGEVERVVELLADARLITTDQRTATLAHERLIDAWPWLRKLMNEN
ncbi:MAG: NACHT domain-containing protein, partial [Chloroflexi bacterium]|nr:NACHT domain-containing protein [Chloroflexota bacterium]